MEDKRLDFNQPLLSVRRFSSAPTPPETVNDRGRDGSLPKIPSLPAYKSELKSGPVRNPGTVPFLWEKTPGRPKDESKSQNHPPQEPVRAPKLPPGRALNVRKQNFDKGCECDNLKHSVARTVISNNQNASSFDTNVSKGERFDDGLAEKNESSDSDNSDGAYLDAIDTLSTTDSFFLNCSVSGLSGLDSADVKSCGTFLTDPETRDLMMDRFLPAAKAMTSGSPQYSTRKQPVVKEPPIRANALVSAVKNYPVKQPKPNTFLHHMQTDVFPEDSDDEIDDHEEPDYLATKVCGLFPRFLFKNYFHQINPVLGLKRQMRIPLSSGCRTEAKSKHAGSPTGPRSDVGADLAHEQRPRGGCKDSGRRENQKREHRKLNGSSPFGDLQTTNMSSYHSHPSPSYPPNEKGFPTISEKAARYKNGFGQQRKDQKNFRELLAAENDECGSTSTCSVAEKIVYIDSIHVESEDPTTDDSGVELTQYKGDDSDFTVENKQLKKTRVMDPYCQNTIHLNAIDARKITSTKTSVSVDPYSSSSFKLNHDQQMDVEKRPKLKPYLQSPTSLKVSAVPDDRKIDFENQQPRKSDKGTYDGQPLAFPLLLPKSPSESWLQRALPALSSKTSSSSLGIVNDIKTKASAPPIHPKWETIVKTSSPQQSPLQYPEESLPPIPEV